jgi:glycosyltransferase involved in cell wall biosynthesis
MKPFVSLILPYWQRPAAVEKALVTLKPELERIQLEIIVVDDGSPMPFVRPPEWSDIEVVRLPLKDRPLNPCVPINRGVEVARGEYIALSCAEILHSQGPVLDKLLWPVEHYGSELYVTAGCWSPDEKRWHAHSTVPPMADDFQLPIGSHFHFMSMMHRSLWDKAGGFDEEYREGAGYEDADFLMRLQRVGAKFLLRDDVVVEHPRAGTRAAWTRAMHKRNAELFRSKWC